MFDDYGNQYSKSTLGSNIVAKVITGDGSFLPTTMTVDGDYSIAVTPKYPPKSFSMLIYYTKDVNSIQALISNPIVTEVITTLDWKKTELHGENLSGTKVDENMKFNVLLKDVKGYCFETDKTVTVKISGPFVSRDIAN